MKNTRACPSERRAIRTLRGAPSRNPRVMALCRGKLVVVSSDSGVVRAALSGPVIALSCPSRRESEEPRPRK